MKGVLALIGFITLVVSLFLYTMYTKQEKWTDLYDEGKVATGTVQVTYKGVDVTYIVDGKSYQFGIRSKPRGIFNGEKYAVYYDPGQPNKSVVDFNVPIYDTLLFTSICVDTFEKIGASSGGLIRFQYSYHDVQLDRYHKIKMDSIDDSGPYKVWVSNSNPKLSYFTGKQCPH